MKFKDKLLMAIDNIWRRKLIFLINTILGIVAITLLAMVVHMYNRTTYTNKEINRITVLSEDEIYFLSLKTFNFKENENLINRVLDFYEEIKNIETVNWFGTYAIDDFFLDNKIEGLEEIYKKYSSVSDSMFSMYQLLPIPIAVYEDKGINRISMNIEELDITGVKTDSDISELNITDEYIEVLVGSELKEYFEKGKIYSYHQSDEKVSIKVVGYLQEDSIFYKENVLGGAPVYICLDGYMVFPEKYNYELDVYGSAITNNAMIYSHDSDIKNKIEILSHKYNINVDLNSLEGIMKDTLKENVMYQNIKLLVIFIFILTVIAYSASGIVGILTRKNEVGIFYSCGLSTQNIISTIAIENIIQLIIVYVISALFIYTKFLESNASTLSALGTEKDIFIRYDSIILLAVVFSILMVVTIFPAIILRMMPIGSMVNDN